MLLFPFSTVNRWLKEKEVRYFVVPPFVRVCACLQESYSQISVPTSYLDTFAELKNRHYNGRREFNRLLEVDVHVFVLSCSL